MSTAAGDTTTYTCPGDGNADMIMFAHTTSSMDNYAYVVTDPSGVIFRSSSLEIPLILKVRVPVLVWFGGFLTLVILPLL